MSTRTYSWIVFGLFFALAGSAAAADPPFPIHAPKDAFALMEIRAEAMQKRPDLKPVVELLRRMEEWMPMSPLSVTELQIAFCPRQTGDQPGPDPAMPFIVMQFTDPAAAQVLVDSTEGLVAKEHNGKKYLSSPTPRYPSIYKIDERTLALSFDRLIESYLDDATPPAEIRAALGRPSMQGEMRFVFLPGSQAAAIEKNFSQTPAGFIPPPMFGLVKMLKHTRQIAGRISLESDEFLRIELEPTTDDGRKEIQDRIDSAVTFLRDLVNDVALPQIERLPIPDDLKKIAKPFADATLGKVKLAAEGKQVVVTMPVTAETADLARTWLPVGTKELLASFERDMERMNGFRLQSVARYLRNYVTKNSHYPDDICDRLGKPMMSWRVELMQDQAEYLFRDKELDGSQPWNAEVNRSILAGVNYPIVAEGRRVQGIGVASIFRFTGPGTLFPARRPVGDAQVKDGLATTILCVMLGRAQAIPWAQPGDLPFDEKNPAAALGKPPSDGFMVMFCDGSIRKLPKNLKPAEWKALITPSGGEEVDVSKFKLLHSAPERFDP